jgi:membrane-bound lytic murein transglycosylase A
VTALRRSAAKAPRALQAILGLALAALAGCSSVPVEPAPTAPAPGAGPASTPPPGAQLHGAALWVPAHYDELPGWQDDDGLRDTWAALLRGCEKPAPAFAAFCADARHAPAADDGFLREWLMQRLQPYRVEAADGRSDGLMTGYFEPLVEASHERRGLFRTPLYEPPADLLTRKPYWTRQQLDTLPAAQAALRGHEIAWVADPLDALLLQVQGSGRLRFTGPDGRAEVVRVRYAAHNDQPYKSVGRWLIEQGELRPDAASWPAIRDWARRHPDRVNELMWSNPRVVFFRLEPLPDASVGPRGSQGVPLTPGRSIAVDPQSVPYGTPVWIDSTRPLTATPLRRLVMAQDSGSAITGAVRADFFCGWGDDAEAEAGRMKQPLRMWALWPRAQPVVVSRQ